MKGHRLLHHFSDRLQELRLVGVAAGNVLQEVLKGGYFMRSGLSRAQNKSASEKIMPKMYDYMHVCIALSSIVVER